MRTGKCKNRLPASHLHCNAVKPASDRTPTTATWADGCSERRESQRWKPDYEAIRTRQLVALSFLSLALNGLLLLFHRRGFSGQLELRTRCVVLHVVGKVIRAGQ